jgi:hypothetical protein
MNCNISGDLFSTAATAHDEERDDIDENVIVAWRRSVVVCCGLWWTSDITITIFFSFDRTMTIRNHTDIVDLHTIVK